MAHRPALPEEFELPTLVNGWTYDPESGKNAHVWVAPDGTQSVGVFCSMGRAYLKVFDERASGFGNGYEIADIAVTDEESHTDAEREKVADIVWEAIHWMEDHAPGEWSHPDVNEAVFDAPPGYELDVYYLESRNTTIYYHREAGEPPDRRTGLEGPDDGDVVTPDEYPYLVIHVWNGSGNATISLAPWTRAHDHQMQEVVETPEECGLDVALTMARAYAREHVTGVQQASTGQADLAQFVGGPT